MSEQRGTPVTLTEMTRRRDAWRRDAEHYKRQAANLKAVVDRLEREAESARRTVERAVYDRTNADLRAEHGWDEARRAAYALTDRGPAIAYRIRAELVCCHIYEQMQPLLNRGEDGADYPELLDLEELAELHGLRFHDLCYWGEAAARLAENFGREPSDDE